MHMTKAQYSLKCVHCTCVAVPHGDLHQTSKQMQFGSIQYVLYGGIVDQA